MSIIEEAKSMLDLRTMVSLPKQRDCGKYLIACCPFHEDSHPSLIVYKDGWRCLSSNCSRPKGSALDWIAYVMGITNPTGSDIYDIAVEIAACKTMSFTSSGRSHEISHELLRKSRKPKRKKRLPVLDPDIAIKYFKLHDKKSRQYLHDRGFSGKAINFFKFGLAGDAISIPVWEGLPGKSKLLSMRFRNLHDEPRYYGQRGYNKAELFNKFVIDILLRLKDESLIKVSETLYVFFGEFDAALALSQFGIPAVSPTNGCNTIKSEWFDGLDDIIFIPDHGEEQQARVAAAKIGVRAKVGKLPYTKAIGKDFTEQWLSIVGEAGAYMLMVNYFKTSEVFYKALDHLLEDF